MSHYYKTRGRRGARRLISITVRGVSAEFMVYSNLFSGGRIDEGTRLLLEYMVLPEKGLILDVGCGYGVIGIIAVKLNPKLKAYMVDIDPLAVKTTRYNVRLNNVEDRVIVLRGDKYKPVEGMFFNAIYSNPPLSAGMNTVEEIILEAKQHLAENGHAQFVLARGGEHIANKARENYSIVEVKRKKGYILLTVKP